MKSWVYIRHWTCTDRFSDEGGLVVRHDEANDDLEREPGVADALDVEERRDRIPPLFLQLPAGGAAGSRLVDPEGAVVVVVDVEGDVAKDRHSHAVVSLETERHDRRDYEEHRDASDHLRRRQRQS